MDQMSINNSYLHQQQHQAFNSNDSRHYSNNLYSYYGAPSTDLVDTMNPLDNEANNQSKDMGNTQTVSQDNSMGLTMSTSHTPTNSSMNQRNSISPSPSAKKQKTNHDTKKPKAASKAKEVQVNSG